MNEIFICDGLAQKALSKNNHTALATAFAISFGIGGRDFAGKVLKKLENACIAEDESEE